MNRRARGNTLIAIGVMTLVLTLTLSAALAPDVGTETQTSDGENRLTLAGSQGGGPAWHKYGSVYLLNGSDIVWREASADSYFDVTKLENGSVLAGFMHSGYQQCGPYESPCTKTGFRVIRPNPKPHVIAEYSFPVRTARNSEVHDAEPLPSGGYVLTDMDSERIFIVENGEVTWQWNAGSFYEAPKDPTKTDWLHINDVDRISKGRYLVSVRNANQLIIVERGKRVVEVINEDQSNSNDQDCQKSKQLSDTDGDGDIRCGDPNIINHQHNPQWLGNGAVLVADSDNDRVVELHRTSDGTWEPAWSLESAGGVKLSWPRDADRLPNGNTLITDTLNKRILEVNESGDVVWSAKTERIPYEADRLPADETVGAPKYEDQSDNISVSSDIPILSLMLIGVRAVVPSVPFWYSEPQLFLTLVSLILAGAGIVYRVRS